MRHGLAIWAVVLIVGATVVGAAPPASSKETPNFAALDARGWRATDSNAPDAAPGRFRAQPAAGDSRRASPGTLLWEDRFDSTSFEQAFSTAASGGRTVVAGFTLGRGRDFLVRAYDGRTGSLLWMDQLDRGRDEFASGVAIAGGMVFVSGVGSVRGRSYDWMLRAYDVATGHLRWDVNFDLAGGRDFSRGTALAVGGGRVYLGGYGTNAAGDTDWVVRAHEAHTGVLLWQDRRDGGGTDGVFTLAAEGSRVYAGGWAGGDVVDNAVLRAFDGATGALMWSRTLAGVGGVGLTYTGRLSVSGGSVIAGSNVVETGSLQLRPVIEALHPMTGELQWRHRIASGGDYDWLSGLGAAGDLVVGTGLGGAACRLGPSPPSNCEAIVRAFKISTGTLVWERRLDLSALDDTADLVTIRGSEVFVLAQRRWTLLFPGCCVIGQWVAQSLDSRTGELLWRTIGRFAESGVYNLAVDGNVLFAPGRAIDTSSGDWDLIVRAYDVRARRGTIEPLPFEPPDELRFAGTAGEAAFRLQLDGARPTLEAHGLQPAATEVGTVREGSSVVHLVDVASGTRLMRFALFDAETDGSDDLDMVVFGPAGGFVGSSIGTTSDEAVDIRNPGPGTYRVIIDGFDTDGPDANYTFFSWEVPVGAADNFALSGPSESGDVTVSWSGLGSGLRYLGDIAYREDGAEIGATAVSIDT